MCSLLRGVPRVPAFDSAANVVVVVQGVGGKRPSVGLCSRVRVYLIAETQQDSGQSCWVSAIT